MIHSTIHHLHMISHHAFHLKCQSDIFVWFFIKACTKWTDTLSSRIIGMERFKCIISYCFKNSIFRHDEFSKYSISLWRTVDNRKCSLFTKTYVHNTSFRRSEDDIFLPRFTFVRSIIATYSLHLDAINSYIVGSCIGSIGEIETNNFSIFYRKFIIFIPVNHLFIPISPHESELPIFTAKRSELVVFIQKDIMKN